MSKMDYTKNKVMNKRKTKLANIEKTGNLNA